MNTNEPNTSGEQSPDKKRIPTDAIRADAQKHLDRLDYHPKETSAREFRREGDKEISYLIEPLLHSVGTACLAGSSDTGKSALLRQLGAAVTAGDEKWLGFPIHAKHRSVIYVSTEDGADATRFVVNRQTARYHEDEIRDMRFIFDYDDLLTTLGEALDMRPADLVIIDCYADIYDGDLKDSQRIRTSLTPYQLLADRHQCLFLFLHHTGKRTENLIPSKNNLLSGQALEAKMRLVFELRADQMRPNDRHLCIVKGNYLANSYKKESFVLRFNEDDFTFVNAGERTPFEMLVKGEDVDDAKAKYEQARDLKKDGFSQEEIAKEMGFANRSSISRLFEKAKKMGWDKNEPKEEEADE